MLPSSARHRMKVVVAGDEDRWEDAAATDLLPIPLHRRWPCAGVSRDPGVVVAAMDARGGRGVLPCRVEEEEEEEALLRLDPGSGPARRWHLRLRPRPHAWADVADEDAHPQPRICPQSHPCRWASAME